MKRWQVSLTRSLYLTLGAAAILSTGCATASPRMPALLTGTEEVPRVATDGSGRADLSVDWFKCPSATSSSNCSTLMGTVTTVGTAATQVVRQGVPGQNGPLVVSLLKTGDNTWQVPSGAVLTPTQYEAYQHGELYVNVDSATYRNGELRVQLEP